MQYMNYSSTIELRARKFPSESCVTYMELQQIGKVFIGLSNKPKISKAQDHTSNLICCPYIDMGRLGLPVVW